MFSTVSARFYTARIYTMSVIYNKSIVVVSSWMVLRRVDE